METLLQAAGVRKSFTGPGGHAEVLRGVSLDLRRNEDVALVGRSGSGKSTLLNVLGALTRADAGSVRIGGTDLTALETRQAARLRRTQLGFVFQGGNLLGHLTAQQNVALPYARDIRPGRAVASALLEQVGLADRAEHHPSELSAGQQQRVALARALVNSPRVVLADEPTGNLDRQTEGEVLSLLRAVAAEGRTVLIVTHSEAVSAAADRVLRIDAGHLVEQETTI